MPKLVVLPILVAVAAPSSNVDCDDEVNKCMSRCTDHYDGGRLERGTDAYFCSQGCALVDSGAIQDADFICGAAEGKRLWKCVENCQTASQDHPERVTMCNWGCGYWDPSPGPPTPAPPTPTPPLPTPGPTPPPPTPAPTPTPSPSPIPRPTPAPSPQEGVVLGFVSKGLDGWKQYDWEALTHLAGWHKYDDDVKAMAKKHGVKLFKNHDSSCSIDCYTSDSDKEKAVQEILDNVKEHDLDGVFFDEERSFVQISRKQKDGYADFVRRAADALRPLGKTVFVCVAGRPSYEFRSYDYAPMADASEFLFIMGYDMHFWDDYSCVLNGECSPAEAALPDVKDGVKQYLKQVSGSKLVLGLPWYGQRYMYVGPVPFDAGQVDYKDVLRYMDESEIKNLKLVRNDQSWKLVCKGACDPDGHTGGAIWFDDAQTLAPKYHLARDNGLAGVGVWRLDSAPYDGSHDDERDAMWGALAAWNAAEAQVV